MGQACTTGQLFISEGGNSGVGVMGLGGHRKQHNHKQHVVNSNKSEETEEVSSYEKIRDSYLQLWCIYDYFLKLFFLIRKFFICHLCITSV